MDSNLPNLIEDIKTFNASESYNIYVIKNRVYFIAIDKCSTRLKNLHKKYNGITAVGRPFGLLGALLTLVPAEIFVGPKLREERERVLADLRRVEVADLDGLPGYKILKQDIKFEEKKKDRYKVHLTEKHILILQGDDARRLQAAIG